MLTSEKGQMLLLMMLTLTVVFAVGVAVLDVGIWLTERRGISRAADLAGLAGSLDLPADPDAARANALEWASRNGYTDGVDGVEIEVELLCSNDIVNPPSDICENPAPGSPEPSSCLPEVGCDTLRVIITKPGERLLADIFGVPNVLIGFGAAAGLDFDLIPLDTVLMLDATGSMGTSPCNSQDNNAGCPIKEAKDASGVFTDLLLADDNTRRQVAFAPYRGCYRPPRNYSACVPADTVIGLTGDVNTAQAGIDDTTAQGGSGTNVCLGLFTGRDLLRGPAAQTSPNTRQFVVILTDGDNTYNSNSYGQGQPPQDCTPNTSPWNSDSNTGSGCSSAQTRERQLDVKTKALADDLHDDGVEIYVVGFGICGSASNQMPSGSYCAGIGDGQHDNSADRRLLKCIASSSPDSNDHYFEVPSASDLPEIFQIIAFQIAGRALVE